MMWSKETYVTYAYTHFDKKKLHEKQITFGQ